MYRARNVRLAQPQRIEPDGSHVETLRAMGFGEAAARHALSRCNNNVENAINMLTSLPAGWEPPPEEAAAAAAVPAADAAAEAAGAQQQAATDGQGAASGSSDGAAANASGEGTADRDGPAVATAVAAAFLTDGAEGDQHESSEPAAQSNSASAEGGSQQGAVDAQLDTAQTEPGTTEDVPAGGADAANPGEAVAGLAAVADAEAAAANAALAGGGGIVAVDTDGNAAELSNDTYRQLAQMLSMGGSSGELEDGNMQGFMQVRISASSRIPCCLNVYVSVELALAASMCQAAQWQC